MAETRTQLFLGFEPDPSWTQAFVAHRAKIEAVVHDFPYRWVSPANYHMTLHYFGACTDALKQKLLHAMAKLPWQTAIPMATKQWSLMGQRSPRSLTLELSMNLNHAFLFETQRWVQEHTQQTFAPTQFRPHVTFGKHKGRVTPDNHHTLNQRLAQVDLFQQPITIHRCALYETRIKDGQASYVPLAFTQ